MPTFKLGMLKRPVVLFCIQGAQLPSEAVSGLPGGAGGAAGVGERGTTSANH